jgi:hypothetical protein
VLGEVVDDGGDEILAVVCVVGSCSPVGVADTQEP